LAKEVGKINSRKGQKALGGLPGSCSSSYFFDICIVRQKTRQTKKTEYI
jgi:hypothetical protein